MLARSLSSRDVAVAAISYVVASTTLVSDLQGWFTYGPRFAWPLLVAFALNLLLCLSVAELASSFPRAGAIYSFTAAVLSPWPWHQSLGVFTAVTLVGTTALAGGGEISSGAFSLAALLGTDIDTRWLVATLVAAALVPNLLDLRATSRVALIVVLVMVGLRWAFGLVGVLGLARTGPWSAANLVAHGADASMWPALSGGFGLAFWTFVGVEAVAPFAEETRKASSVLARGMIAALVVVMATSLALGIGIVGTLPAAAWRELGRSAAACGGDCPHLAVGQLMLGAPGRILMAVTAVASCFGTVMIGIGGVGRVLYALARDEGIFGRFSASLAQSTHPGRVPRPALVAAALLVVMPPLFARQVISWVLPASLIWVLLYVLYHALVVLDRRLSAGRPRAFRVPLWVASLGAIATAAAVPALFLQVEALGLIGRAAAVVAAAAAITLLARRTRAAR